MFDLSTIQLMNEFAAEATTYGFRQRDSINPSCLRSEEVGLIYGTCAAQQQPPEFVLDGVLAVPFTHEQWENSQFRQCPQCGAIFQIDPLRPWKSTCSDKCESVWMPF